MDIAGIVGLILSAITAYSSLKKEKRTPERSLEFLGSIEPLLEILSFCKDTHTAFQHVHLRVLPDFIEATEASRDLSLLSKNWVIVEDHYERELEQQVVGRAKDFAFPEKPKKGSGRIGTPKSIALEIEGIEKQFPRLLELIVGYGNMYQDMCTKIDCEETPKGVSDLKPRMIRSAGRILGRADMIMRDTVSVVLYAYDQVFPAEAASG